jgi:hypothetical protein
MYKHHYTKKNFIYIPFIPTIQLSKSNGKDDIVQIFIFDMMFPRVPFSSVVYKDEFGDTNPTFN